MMKEGLSQRWIRESKRIWTTCLRILGALMFSDCHRYTKDYMTSVATDHVRQHSLPVTIRIVPPICIYQVLLISHFGEKISIRKSLSSSCSSLQRSRSNSTLFSFFSVSSCPPIQQLHFYKSAFEVDCYNHSSAMLERPENALSSLKKIAETCHCSCNSFTASVMGVVVDATRPMYRERDKDYIMELKIVDELVNEAQVFGVLVKYCSVYVFSKERKELELVNEIGQLVYLNSFTFSLWNEIKLETKYRSSIERLYSLRLGEDGIVPFRKLVATAEVDDLKHPELQFRARNLTKWFRENYFFDKFKITLGINLINNYCVMAEPFSMILKVSQTGLEEVQLEKAMENHLALEDGHGNTFIINRDSLPSPMPEVEYVVIRSIRYIGNFYEIVPTETGWLLGLPPGFEEQYKTAMNYCAISRFNERFLLRNHKTCNLSKINYVSTQVTPLAKLHERIDTYQNKESQKEDLKVEDLYMVEAVVINYTGRLHLFHSELQMITDEEYLDSLTDDQRTELVQKGVLEYLYEGLIGVLDRSSQHIGRLMYIHLFSNEQRCRFFDSSIIEQLNKRAGQANNRQLQETVKREIDKKLENLIEKSDFTNTVSMLLEPIKSDVLLYRLTNTVFI